ncbi:MAG: biotin transporter BioY [Oscillospiraceae bacterium]|jgi:biotin transport system substrate-specific component|nr:biotin transporter BioY [Oscillospiraceae bacterium]
MNMKTRDLAAIGLLAALICVAAPWKIPIGPIPITLATLTLYLAAAVLGTKRGLAAVSVYVALGVVGLPVFSGFQGGAHVLFGPTGGYIIGYLPCAAAIGLTVEKARGRLWSYPVGMVIGTILCYTCGTAWFVWQANTTVAHALAVCVLPFLPFDAVKVIIASAVAPVVRVRAARAM